MQETALIAELYIAWRMEIRWCAVPTGEKNVQPFRLAFRFLCVPVTERTAPTIMNTVWNG